MTSAQFGKFELGRTFKNVSKLRSAYAKMPAGRQAKKQLQEQDKYDQIAPKAWSQT